MLTTTRSSGVAWPTRLGGGTADPRRARARQLQRRRGLGFGAKGGFDEGFKGERAASIYRAHGPLGVRATSRTSGRGRTPPRNRVQLGWRREEGPTGGARSAVTAGEGRGVDRAWGMSWAGAGGVLGRGRRKKKERGRWAGLKTRKREKSWFSIFEKIQTHSI